jgi:uncharacterized membrane protein YccC
MVSPSDRVDLHVNLHDGIRTRHTPHVAKSSSRAATEALHACLRLQRSHVEIAPGVRTGITIAIVFLLGLPSGNIGVSTSIAVGVLFTAILDTSDAPRVRLQLLMWGMLWTSGAVLLGGVVGLTGTLHVLVALPLAFLCGYAGALGMRAGLTGVVCLVMFAFYAGYDIGVNVAIVDAALFVVGGCITIAVNLAMSPLRRLPSVRTGVARSYQEIQQAASRRGLKLATPAIAAEIFAARTVAGHRGCAGDTAAWVDDLLRDAERARLGLLALLAERSLNPTYVDALATSAGRLAGAIADEVRGPLGLPGRRRRSRSDRFLSQLEITAAAAPDARLAILAEELTAPLGAAVERLRAAWPIGSRADVQPPRWHGTPIIPRLRAHAHLSDPVLEHAIRLTIAFGGATLLAVIINQSHAYWVPLTVAWVTKPDLSSTVTRITMRIVGTILGLAVVTALVLAVSDFSRRDVVISIAIGAAGALALAFLWANYPVAVVGITSFVLLLEAFDSTTLESNVIARFLATVAAGAWVLLVSAIRPRRAGNATLDTLRSTLAALRAYATVVQTGGDVEAARAEVLIQRTAALAAVTASMSEPPGLWERPAPRIDPQQAAAILTDMVDGASTILAEELLERHGDEDPGLWQRVDADLADIDARIQALADQPAGRGSVA